MGSIALLDIVSPVAGAAAIQSLIETWSYSTRAKGL